MNEVVTCFKARYFAGETAKVKVSAPSASAVFVVVGSSQYDLTKNDSSDIWSLVLPTAALSAGRVNWTLFVKNADLSVEALAHNSFTILCAGVSPKRQIIEKIDEAIRTWGTNPNRTISVGEINISYKSLNELLAVRAQFIQQAEAEETGAAKSGGVRMVEVHF